MSKSTIHIISFAIPYPPDYGGVIDVYYKLKALAEQNIDIILHCFQYDDRTPSEKLADICIEVNYYKRTINLKKAIGTTPYIMASRYNEDLLNRLSEDNFPILFEGMHTAEIAKHSKLTNRRKALRMHNVEWNYYALLAEQESNLVKKLYYAIESKRLWKAQSILEKMDIVFTIAHQEQEELMQQHNNCAYLPVFHANEKITCQAGKGKYILYHGNLKVAENKKAVEFIIAELYENNKVKWPLVIAGLMDEKEGEQYRDSEFIRYEKNLSAHEMNNLIQHAHIHLLPTFQNTGIKLKLINALHQGRFCVVNDNMINGTGLENLVNLANTPDEMIQSIAELWEVEFTQEKIEHRTKVLTELFSNKKGATQISQWLNHLPS